MTDSFSLFPDVLMTKQKFIYVFCSQRHLEGLQIISSIFDVTPKQQINKSNIPVYIVSHLGHSNRKTGPKLEATGLLLSF